MVKISKLYYWALNKSIVFRWALYIIPVTALLWIPGILGLTAFPDTHIWGTKLVRTTHFQSEHILIYSYGGQSGSLFYGADSGHPPQYS
jgi:hypothetical protein